MTNYDQFLSHSASVMKESAIRQMGSVLSQSKDMVSFAPGYPAEDQFPWLDFTEIAKDLLNGSDGSVLQYGPTRGYAPLRGANDGGVPLRVLVNLQTFDGGFSSAARTFFTFSSSVLLSMP